MIEVLISDDKSAGYKNNHMFFQERHEWAQTTCKSYVGMNVEDVSDVSMLWDEIATYRFNDEKDAVMFKLKWD